jgi:hypothetical protein
VAGDGSEIEGFYSETFTVTDAPGCESDLPGDIDGDGEVGFGDFVILSTNWQQEVQPFTAGLVSDVDDLRWL